jgi:L-ribulose-5-phosphate 4-epimerase
VTRPLTSDEIEGEYERATGEVIVETFATRELAPLGRPAVLVASHGPFTWGATEREAVENAIALEVVAAGAYHSVVLAGKLEPIAPELLHRHFSRKHGAAAYYGQPT